MGSNFGRLHFGRAYGGLAVLFFTTFDWVGVYAMEYDVDYIKEWLQSQGIRQSKLAVLAGYGESTVNNWLNGFSKPIAEPKIVQALKDLDCPYVTLVSEDELVDDEPVAPMYQPPTDPDRLPIELAQMLSGLPIWRALEVLRQVEAVINQSPVSIPASE